MSFDSIIQQMGRAGKKAGASVFILFIPKSIKIKDLREIKKRISGAFLLFQQTPSFKRIINCLKLPIKMSLFNKIVIINRDLSNSKSIAVKSEADLDLNDRADLFLKDLAINAKQNCLHKKNIGPVNQIVLSVQSFLIKFLNISIFYNIKNCVFYLDMMT